MERLFSPGERRNITIARKLPSKAWILALTSAMFLPLMGRGFISDDYLHLYSSAFASIRSGLTRADIFSFYTPITWLTYKADWTLWGPAPFAFCAVNLILHLVNISLLYRMALRFSQSSLAAWWTAFGFALLFPANSWAVMWAATRAHLLVTTFYLAAMIATLSFIRTKQSRLFPAVAIVAFAAMCIFSKENGITIPVSVSMILIHNRFSRDRRSVPLSWVIGVFGALAGVIVGYGFLRAESGARPIHIGDGMEYTYALSPKLLVENALRYSWRTFGLLSLLAGAIGLSQFISRQHPSLKGILKRDVLFSAGLFIVTISPVVLMSTRSGIYTYLPGISAALLFGVTVRALYENNLETATAPQKWTLLELIPILIAVAIFIAFTVGNNQKWKVMAETNTSVLNQLAALQPTVESSALTVLTYNEIDAVHRFPDGFAAWGFGYGIKVLYMNPSAEGIIVRNGASFLTYGRLPLIHFEYKSDNGLPHVVRTPEAAVH
jgi:hypothetical protein